MNLYTSDSHIGHAEVIQFSRRPFLATEERAGVVRSKRNGVLLDVALMNQYLVFQLREAERQLAQAGGGHLVHCGDLCFNYAKYVEEHGRIFTSPRDNIIKSGNHDEIHEPRNNKSRNARQMAAYLGDFEQVVGTVSGWEAEGLVLQDLLDGRPVSVLVTHAPIPHMWGCDVNVHGHLHNDILMQDPHRDGYEWSYDSPTHFNCGVELHAFKPVTLQALADAHRSGYAAARAELAARGVENVRSVA